MDRATYETTARLLNDGEWEEVLNYFDEFSDVFYQHPELATIVLGHLSELIGCGGLDLPEVWLMVIGAASRRYHSEFPEPPFIYND